MEDVEGREIIVCFTCEVVLTEYGYDLDIVHYTPEIPPLIPQPNNLIVKEQTT